MLFLSQWNHISHDIYVIRVFTLDVNNDVLTLSQHLACLIEKDGTVLFKTKSNFKMCVCICLFIKPGKCIKIQLLFQSGYVMQYESFPHSTPGLLIKSFTLVLNNETGLKLIQSWQ